MEQLLKVALQSGIGYQEFWDLTIGEVILIIKSKAELRELEEKKNLATNYNLATMIAMAVNRSLSGKPIPSLYELYPQMFQEELEAQNWQRIKANWLNFANEHNKLLRGETENDC